MSITPASITDGAAYSSGAYFLDDAAQTAISPDDEPALARAPSAGFADQMQSSMAALEQRFTAFTQMLTRELASLERQFSSALRSMVSDAKRADAAHADAANANASSATGASAARPGEPLAGRISPYDGIINRAAARNGLDPALVGAVVRQESGFRADAVSPAGAQGLMQLMPSTARDLGVADPFDPRQNVDGGARLLRSLIDRYDGRLDFALAAYNAGPGAVDRYGGVPPYPETQSYVSAILADYRTRALRSS
jgi:soluble lytic murein transglycosylase-like protein